MNIRDYDDYSNYGKEGAAPALRPGLLHRARAAVSGLLVLTAMVPLLLLCISVTINDATLPLQFLAFVPRWVWLVCAFVPLAPALVVRPRTLPGYGRWRRRLTAVAVTLLLLGAAYVLLVDWRMGNLLRGRPTGGALSVAHWNLSLPETEHWNGLFPTAVGVPGGAATQQVSVIPAPSVYLLTTNQNNAVFDESLRKLRTDGQTWNVRRNGEFAVISTLPILSVKLARLESVGVVPGTMADRARWEEFYNRWAPRLGIALRSFTGDSGAEVFEVELDATAQLGRKVRFWLIDLPSDPLINRRAEAVAVRDWIVAQKALADGLHQPDVIIGDCNIPRGCRALDVVLEAAGRPMSHAFDQAAWGPAVSWPRAMPMLHIDNCYLAPGLVAASYELIRTPVSDHWAQRVEIAVEK